jgi:hypothetical protein
MAQVVEHLLRVGGKDLEMLHSKAILLNLDQMLGDAGSITKQKEKKQMPLNSG